MVNQVRCKRCNHVLKNKESIKLGYGKTCFRIVNYPKIEQNISSDMDFMKLEIKMLKKLVNELKTNGIKQKDSIERLKQETTKVQTIERVNMSNVVSELKTLFNRTNGNWKSILKPIPTNLYI